MPRKTFGLRLGANEKPDAEDNAAQTEQERAFAMPQKSQRDVERRRHGAFGGFGRVTLRSRTALPGRNLSWSVTMTCSRSERPPSTSE